MAKTRLRVSDHALVRYLERVRGFKFDREAEEICRICGNVTNGRVKSNGCIFEIKDGCLISVLPDTGRPNRTKREEVAAMEI